MAHRCATSQVIGDVTLGADVIIHPGAIIRAIGDSSICIGNGCVIEELCVIESAENSSLHIGSENMFQVGCRVRAAEIGDFNIFGPKSDLDHGVRIANLVQVGAGVHIPAGSELSDNMVVFRNGLEGEQDANVSRRTSAENIQTLKLYRESLLVDSSRFRKQLMETER